MKDVFDRVSRGAEWFCSRMLLGFLSLVVFVASAFVPVWTSCSAGTLATVGKTTYYGFPIPLRGLAEGGSSLDNLLIAGLVDLLFWAGVVTFCDLRFFQGKDRLPITGRCFLLNWLSVCGGIVGLALLAVLITHLVS